MISFEDGVRLVRIQERVKSATFIELKKDGHHKSSEGAVTLSFCLPNIFDDSGPYWTVDVYSYVLCPDGRSKVFSGRTASEAISKAEDGVRDWCMPTEMEEFGKAMGLDHEEDECFNDAHPSPDADLPI